MQTAAEHISDESLSLMTTMQQNELTESATYAAIAARMKPGKNRDTLEQLGKDERSHYEIWRRYTGQEMTPQRGKVFLRVLLSIVFGFTFVIKQMENGEEAAQAEYEKLEQEIPESRQVRADEANHEHALLEMLDEERLQYVGSMVLGLNDALVELTGTLAGLTLALQNTRIIALSGLITGISATLSMASSEFLSAKSEGRPDALKSCAYTGIAYLITVTLLILPYLLLPDNAYLVALGIMLVTVVAIIFFFNYYISVAKGLPFKRRFWEMAGISLGVAALSFVIGLLVKNWLGIEM